MIQWTQAEIQQLTKDYTIGLPLRVIANRLGRSYTALCKAVSRFKIPPNKNLTRKINTKKLLVLEDNWVDFTTVLSYLRYIDINVNLLRDKYLDGEQLYSIHTKILTSSQVLLYANRKRIESGSPLFKVRNLSW